MAEDKEKKRQYSRAYYLAHRAEILKRQSAQRKQWRKDHPKEMREQWKQRKAWRLAHPEKERERRKKYLATHPEYRRKEKKRYRAAHPEKVREALKRYKAAHPEYRRAQKHRRRALERGASVSTITPAQLRALMESQHGRCAFCGKNITGKGKHHLDHIQPLALGGSHTIENLQYLCPACNMRKSAKPPEIAMREVGLLPLL